MLSLASYNRGKAVRYAKKWALRRNPEYYNFDNIGGDCTNFISQCIYAGCGIMNYTPTLGWYYNSISSRSPSWTGVMFLRNFLITNKASGPYARETSTNDIMPGDIIQLGKPGGSYYHSLMVCETEREILICTHTDDAYMRPLNTYAISAIRYIHIEGARIWTP